jgi:hypothetical protein
MTFCRSGHNVREEREEKRWQQRRKSLAQYAATFHDPAYAFLHAFQLWYESAGL